MRTTRRTICSEHVLSPEEFERLLQSAEKFQKLHRPQLLNKRHPRRQRPAPRRLARNTRRLLRFPEGDEVVSIVVGGVSGFLRQCDVIYPTCSARLLALVILASRGSQ
jgi:hypothetical protein